MNRNVQQLAEHLLKTGYDGLSMKEKRVLKRMANRLAISENINETFHERLTLGERLADRVAAFGGSWTFIISFGIVLAVWVIINTVILSDKAIFDPYPFVFLNLVLSMLAAVQAPVIMMSQNRQANKDRLTAIPGQCMLTDGIAAAYRDGKSRFDGRNAVEPVMVTESKGREASPNLYQTDIDNYLQDHALSDEVFGPLGLVVRVNGPDEMKTLAQGMEGQLTATLQMDDGDTALARELMPILERKAGRLLVNGFPTGVEVADSMVHGGPYPASTNFGATSVGTLSIRRFLRPVCYQNTPESLLPEDLRNS